MHFSRAQKSSSSSPCTLSDPLRSQLWSHLSIRTPSPLPRAELPLAIDCADLLQGQPSGSRLHSAPGKRPHLHPIEPVQQHTQWLLLRRAQTVPLLLRARRSGMRVPLDLSSNSRYDTMPYPMAEEKPPSLPPCHAPATATKIRPTDSDQFVQSLSNPYYLHHLCVQKYFEDDAFVEWCKYLKYFSQPEYLPFLSYVKNACGVASFPSPDFLAHARRSLKTPRSG